MEKLNATLNSVKALRSSVRQCFEHLAEGASNDKFLNEFQENFTNINIQLRYTLYYSFYSLFL